MALRRIFAPIPTSGPLGPFGIQRSNSINWFLPSDVAGTNVKIRGGNRGWSLTGGSAVSTDFAAYTSDGADAPAGAAFGTATVVLPGDGTVASSGDLGPVVRGPDGKVVVFYDLNDPVFVNTPIQYGFYADGTIVVSPPPAPTGINTTSEYWLELEINTAKDAYQIFGDSIANGYNVSFELASWNLFASQFDACVCIEAMVTDGSYLHFSDSGLYPFLYDEIRPSGAHGIAQLGNNDLSYNDLTVLKAAAQATWANMKAAGCVDVSAWTIPPQAGYPGTEAVRLAFNAWLRANFAALGLRCIYDAAAPSDQGGLAQIGNPAVMDPAFDSGDGTHPNAAGQVQIDNGWIAALNASAGGTVATPFNATLWPALLYPPFPRVVNVESLTFTGPVPSSRNGGTYVPGAYPPLIPQAPDGRLTARNGGTATPAAAPPAVIPPPASSGRVSFTPAPTIAPNLTVVPATTTQKQINSTFRIVDLRLNNQAN